MATFDNDTPADSPRAFQLAKERASSPAPGDTDPGRSPSEHDTLSGEPRTEGSLDEPVNEILRKLAGRESIPLTAVDSGAAYDALHTPSPPQAQEPDVPSIVVDATTESGLTRARARRQAEATTEVKARAAGPRRAIQVGVAAGVLLLIGIGGRLVEGRDGARSAAPASPSATLAASQKAPSNDVRAASLSSDVRAASQTKPSNDVRAAMPAHSDEACAASAAAPDGAHRIGPVAAGSAPAPATSVDSRTVHRAEPTTRSRAERRSAAKPEDMQTESPLP